METATVTHLPTGRTWTVPALTSRPTNRQRVALRARSVGSAATVFPCSACGHATAATARTAPVVETTYGPVRIPTGTADRIVNDHPSFHVDRPVAYSDRTVANLCAPCNGSDGRHAQRATLEAIALALLDGRAT